MRKMIMAYRRSLWLAILSCCVLCGCIDNADDETEEEYAISVGAALPTFSVKMSTGETVSSQDLKGSVSVIVFFNTGCPDCQKELPILQRVYDHCITEGKDVRFLCISRSQDAGSIATYWRENGLTLPYSPQGDRGVYSLFASSIIPRVYVVSPSLVITHSFTDNPIATETDILEAIGKY